ncbi:hypothetical protein NHP164001_06170 [Helicobacter trogontum]|uniref:Uncharacterized protein n=1 Tax=Helicobacter trogontum TaxID=50960 RepID=A0ABQ0D2P2_9HELI
MSYSYKYHLNHNCKGLVVYILEVFLIIFRNYWKDININMYANLSSICRVVVCRYYLKWFDAAYKPYIKIIK